MFYSCGWCRQLIRVVLSYFTFLPSARREPPLGFFLPAVAAPMAGIIWFLVRLLIIGAKLGRYAAYVMRAPMVAMASPLLRRCCGLSPVPLAPAKFATRARMLAIVIRRARPSV